MFDLTPTPVQSAAVAAVRSIREEVQESAEAINDSGEIPDQLWSRVADAAQASPSAIADGSSVLLDPVGLTLVAEEIAVGDAGLAFAIIGSALGNIAVADSGAVEDGAVLALYEGFGREPSEYRTVARQDTGGLHVSGRKESVIHAATAKSFLVVASVAEGLGIFRVDASAPTATIERDDLKIGTLALGAARTALVGFDSVEAERITVPADRLLRAVAAARLLLPAISIGAGQAAVDTAAQWVAGRSVRDAPLAVNQGVTFPLVDADIALSRGRLLLWDVASQISACGDLAKLEHRTSRAVAVGCAAGSTAARVASNTMGWRGLSQRFPAEQRYRDTSLLAAIDFDPLQHTIPVLEAV